MHPVSVRVRVHATSSPSSRGPLSSRQTRRQKQLLGCDMILPGPAAERVPRPASRWPGCPFLSAAVLASWKPLFGSRTLSRRLFLTVASKHKAAVKIEVLHHLDSPYIYDCRATAMLVAEAGPLVAMIYRRRPSVARDTRRPTHRCSYSYEGDGS
ncbi:hypothetical protein V8C34DRAFT_315394 [Trichoderma compactum]